MFDNFIIVWESLIFSLFVSNCYNKKNYYALTVFITLNVAAQLFFKDVGNQGTPLIVTIIILQYIWQCLLHKRSSDVFVFVACLSITIVMFFNAVVLFMFRHSLSVSVTDNIRLVIVIAKFLPTMLLLSSDKIINKFISFDDEFGGVWYSVALLLSIIGASSNIIQIVVADYDITPIYDLIFCFILIVAFAILFIYNYIQTDREKLKFEMTEKNAGVIKLQQYRYNIELHNTRNKYRKGEILARREGAFETARYLKQQYTELIIPKVVETGSASLDYHLNSTALRFKEKNIKLDYHIDIKDTSKIAKTWHIDDFNKLAEFVHSNTEGVKKVKVYLKDFKGVCNVTFDLGNTDIDSTLPEGLILNVIDGKVLVTRIIRY